MTIPASAPDLSRFAGRAADWLVDRAIRALIATALAMPWERRVPFMGKTMARSVGPLVGFRRRVLRNLALIYPDWTEARRIEVAARALDNAGRTLIENYSWAEFGARLGQPTLSGPGLEAAEAARAGGQPVIFVTGHYGNHEAPRQVLTARGFVIGGLYKAMANPFVNAHYARTMTGLSGPVFEKGRKGTAGFVRHLRSGGMATLLFDVHDSSGTALPFLGRPAMTSLSAASLALKYDALMIPYFGIRRPDGITFDIAIDAPIPPSDPLTMMAGVTARLEARIADDPGQWFWVHRRWKAITPPGPPPGSDPDPVPEG
jgi:KDO2-lipid IV(A) lauroyltransferase